MAIDDKYKGWAHIQIHCKVKRWGMLKVLFIILFTVNTSIQVLENKEKLFMLKHDSQRNLNENCVPFLMEQFNFL